MPKTNAALLAFNRGLISPRALSRVDLDRTRLSAAIMKNWQPKTQGAMRIRPGTKYTGSSYSDTGAAWGEFVASTNDVGLLEWTPGKMRVWLPSDTGNYLGDTGGIFETPVQRNVFVPMARPSVNATVSFSDTGWSDTSTGGHQATSTPAIDLIPKMINSTTDGVTITASSNIVGYHPYYIANDANAVWYSKHDTGWALVDFGSGNTKQVRSLTLTSPPNGTQAPKDFQLQGSSDAISFTDEITVTGETGWAAFEKRQYYDTGWSDTGANAWRYWRLKVTADVGGPSTLLGVTEMEFFGDTGAGSSGQADVSTGKLVLNAQAVGSVAKASRRITVDTGQAGVEHALSITVEHGPVIFRCGSTSGDDDLISETSLGTGYHNLAFVPTGNFYVTFRSETLTNKIVSSIAVADSGTVEIATPWSAIDLGNIRYDQSADVVYADCVDVAQKKIERRGTGRSWSVVDYAPENGPFKSVASSNAKASLGALYGNTTLTSSEPLFSPDHVGSLFRAFHEGQSGTWVLGAKDAKTDAIKVTGISDTGTIATNLTSNSERKVVFNISGTWAGSIIVERSFDGEDLGFHPVPATYTNLPGDTGAAADTGSFTLYVDDKDDNVETWYRARVQNYTSGVPTVKITYKGGGITGIGRITAYNTNTGVDFEILSRFSDTGGTDNWQEGSWSDHYGYPTAAALNGGRLGHAGGANIYLSVSDDFENFDDIIVGDAGPIVRTLGSGAVDNVYYMLSLSRLVLGTSGSEIAIRSSSLNEVLTPTNNSAVTFSNRGASNLRALAVDSSGIFVARSGSRVFKVGVGNTVETIEDYASTDLTILVPELLEAGVVSIAIQRQPDTRLHCVLADGTVGILTYEPAEDVVCWSTWETNGSVENVACLPGTPEDNVFYHVRRTVNGATKRFLEQWATEAESVGDTGLSWLADCAVAFDTGVAATTIPVAHLPGASVVVWGDDTGQSDGRDFSPDVAGVQTTYAVDTGTGNIDISGTYAGGAKKSVSGLGYTADYVSTKLAYGAAAGTALAQMKRSDKIAFILYQTHNNGLFFGSDTGHLDPLPRKTDQGATVDADKIFATFDQVAMPFPGLWDTDSRIVLRAKAPRPVEVLAAVPSISTKEKI